MQKQILEEIKELRKVIAHVVGTDYDSEQPVFSIDALNKAAKEYQHLSILRNEWIEEDKISTCIKSAPWRAGGFIRKEFGFTRYFKKGRSHYYCKKDLLELAKELKERNIDLARYMELKEDRENFQKKLDTVKDKANKRKYHLPDDLKDVTTSPAKRPDASVVKADIERLKKEFLEKKLDDYVDIYNKGTYAMVKHIYPVKKYIPSDTRRQMLKWRDDFNMANSLLEEITGKREKFTPVPDDQMIRL